MLRVSKGYSAPETIDATNSAAELAEKNGNVEELIKWMIARGLSTYFSGALSAAGVILDHTLELAVRQNNPISLGSTYALQVQTCFSRGDLIGAEKHFVAGFQFFKHPGPERVSFEAAIAAFGAASMNAWMHGHAVVARERFAHMMALTTANNWHSLALSGVFAAQLHVLLREYARAEALAVQTIELSGEHQFPYLKALSRCVLGHARAQLGRAREGIELIRQGIDGLVNINSRLALGNFTAWLAVALEHEGATAAALETFQQALQVNLDEIIYCPETLRLRGELRLKHRQSELAETDLRDSVALAQKMVAK